MTSGSADHLPATQRETGPNLILRGVAILGVVLMAVDATWIGATARPSHEFLYASIAAVAGLVVLFGLAARGAGAVFANPDLLVPFFCYEAMSSMLGWLAIVPASFSWTTPWTVFDAGGLAVGLLVAHLVLVCLLVGWQTLAVLRVVRGERLNLIEELRSVLQQFPRIAVVVLVGAGGLMLPAMGLLTLAGSMQVLPAAMLLTTGWALVWGFVTVAWLPTVVDRRGPLGSTLRVATGRSRRLGSRWVGLLLAWAAALGVVTWHVYSIEEPGNHVHRSQWHVDLKWFGAFPSDNEWYGSLVSGAEVAPVGWFALPLTLLFVAVAIAVKYVVFEWLDEL